MRAASAELPEPARVVELPLTGHIAPLERPAEVNYWLRALAAHARGTAVPGPGVLHAAQSSS